MFARNKTHWHREEDSMKSKVQNFIVLAIVALIGTPTLIAQQHPRYRVVDLGTLGGRHSYGSVNGDGYRLLNNSGEVASFADLASPDPNASFGCYVPDCLQVHAFRWKNGTMTDLGALPTNNNSAAGSINAHGWATGQSQISIVDPVFGFPEFRAVLWKGNHPIDLGVLPGGTESLGVYINDSGQVIGFSTVDSTPDPFGFLGEPTHTFIWENGVKHDIGTLGGLDAFPDTGCSGQTPNVVAGVSSISDAINPSTGLPTVDNFIWKNGNMIDLGNLGGTLPGFNVCVNHRGQIIGEATLPGDLLLHAFLWDGSMHDLGTLGGDNSEAIWLNEAGEIAGSADLPGSELHDAVLWKNGVIHDLGTVDGEPCSRGRGINSSGQVVGGSSDCHNFLHAFLWENGGPMVDLNTLVAPGLKFQLTNAFNINDRGEILAKAAPNSFVPEDDADLGHIVLLIPCHSTLEDGCGGDAQGATSSKPMVVPAKLGPSPMRPRVGNEWRARLERRLRIRIADR
jgi:probable HAF family extracellular repeat protein